MRFCASVCAMSGSLVLTCVLLTPSTVFAQGPKLPEGLKHVPADAMGFVYIRVGTILESEHGKTLLAEIRKDREASKGLLEVEKTLGIAAADVESVTLLMLAPEFIPDPRGPSGPRKHMFDRRKDFDMPPPAKDAEKKAAEERRRIEELKRAIDERIQKLSRDSKNDKRQESPVLFQDGRARDLQHLMHGPIEHGLSFTYQPLNGEFGPPRPLMIVTATKALDRKQILRRHLLGPTSNDHNAVLFVSDRSVLLGQSWELGRFSEAAAQKPKAEPLRSALAMVTEDAWVVAGGHVPADLRRVILGPYTQTRELAPIAPLLQTEMGVALSLGKSLDATFQFTTATEAGAANALQAVKTLAVLGELAIEAGREAGESGGAKLALEKAILKGLAEATVQQKGTAVHAQVKLDLGPAIYKKLIKDMVVHLRSKGDRTKSINNLKEIGLALHGYHDSYKRLPAAGIGDDGTGKPLLSWRVAILPYIEQGQLYKQFDLTKPWDHPTNKKLIAQMPDIFKVPGIDAKEGMTHYRALVGGGAAFEAKGGTRLIDFTDGTSNTFMVVEAGDPTIWTRPDDLPYDPQRPLPKLGTSGDGFVALFGDATVRFIRANTPEATLRALITRNGGEVVQIPD